MPPLYLKAIAALSLFSLFILGSILLFHPGLCRVPATPIEIGVCILLGVEQHAQLQVKALIVLRSRMICLPLLLLVVCATAQFDNASTLVVHDRKKLYFSVRQIYTYLFCLFGRVENGGIEWSASSFTFELNGLFFFLQCQPFYFLGCCCCTTEREGEIFLAWPLFLFVHCWEYLRPL